jgi:hypothetical protein
MLPFRCHGTFASPEDPGFAHKKTPPGQGFIAEADDGTRTHDLLHGKQTL